MIENYITRLKKFFGKNHIIPTKNIDLKDLSFNEKIILSGPEWDPLSIDGFDCSNNDCDGFDCDCNVITANHKRERQR